MRQFLTELGGVNGSLVANKSSDGFDHYFNYYLPGCLALLWLVAAFTFMVTLEFLECFTREQWNRIFQFDSDQQDLSNTSLISFNEEIVGLGPEVIYLVRIIYFSRKTTVDLSTLNLTLVFYESERKTYVQIPPSFFRPSGLNETYQYYSVMKFLLIRDTEFHKIQKTGITHDSQDGDIYISLITLQNITSNKGWVTCVEQRIKSVRLDNLDNSENCFVTTKQSKLDLEGRFATPVMVQIRDFISIFYLLLNLMSYLCIDGVRTLKQEYNYRALWSFRMGGRMAIYSFFWLIGSWGLWLSMLQASPLYRGKPRIKFKYLMIWMSLFIMLCGHGIAIANIYELEPQRIAYSNWFLQRWMDSVVAGFLMSVLYCISTAFLYMILIQLLF